jgi:hypothetical protein
MAVSWRALVLSALLLAGCDSSVSGHQPARDAGIACCLELRCAPGQECFECACRDSECCAALTCLEELQVCVDCSCVFYEDPAGDGGHGQDGDGDGFGADRDCDDTEAAVHPGADEACNQVDDDCDGSTDEDTCPGQRCGAGGCHECCDGADCDDDDGCTADRCVDSSCQHERPAACADCCVELCELVQPLDCTSIFGGDCGESCSALAGVQDDAGCTGEREDFEACLSTCDDPCAGGCDGLGEDLARCVADYCARQPANGDCQTLADAFGL